MPWKPGQSGNPATQFKPGQSGNPAGGNKGPSLRVRLERRLNRLAKNVPYAAKLAEKLKLGDEATVADVITDALCLAALKGNTALMKEIFDRVDGKVRDNVSIDLGGQVDINHRKAVLQDILSDPVAVEHIQALEQRMRSVQVSAGNGDNGDGKARKENGGNGNGMG